MRYLFAALFAALLLAPAASAECGQPAKAATYKTVVVSGSPAVYGPDVKVVDQPYVAATEGTPAVEEVSHIEKVLVTAAYDEKVIDKEATTKPGQWWNWSPNHDTGPFDGPPAFPLDERGTWQGPHDNGGPGPEEEGTYNISNNDNGRSSWFHRGPAVVCPEEFHWVHHDAVYKDVKVVDVPAKDAVPGTDAIEEVSHMEKGALVTPAVPESSKQVLVTEAVPATEVCVVPVSDPVVPESTPVMLAQTGSEGLLWMAGAGLASLLLGGGLTAAAARQKRQD